LILIIFRLINFFSPFPRFKSFKRSLAIMVLESFRSEVSGGPRMQRGEVSGGPRRLRGEVSGGPRMLRREVSGGPRMLRREVLGSSGGRLQEATEAGRCMNAQEGGFRGSKDAREGGFRRSQEAQEGGFRRSMLLITAAREL
jgi:hypothetical protein